MKYITTNIVQNARNVQRDYYQGCRVQRIGLQQGIRKKQMCVNIIFRITELDLCTFDVKEKETPNYFNH